MEDALVGIPEFIRILVVSDVDSFSAAKLADFAIHDADFRNCLNSNCVHSSGIDLCLACGPFVHKNNMEGGANGHRTLEQQIACEGIMTCALSQLENIVCRLAYVSCRSRDPMRTYEDRDFKNHMRLTPNSKNVHNRMMHIMYGVFVGGSAEYPRKVTEGKQGDQTFESAKDRSPAFENILRFADEDLQLKTPGLLKQIITMCTDGCDPEKKDLVNITSLSDEFENSPNKEYTLHISNSFPQSYSTRQRTHILNPGSLRLRGEFALIDLRINSTVRCMDSNRRDNIPLWNVDRVSLRNMHGGYKP